MPGSIECAQIITVACAIDLLEISKVFDIFDLRPEISPNPVNNF
jgi:hypothetical protein